MSEQSVKADPVGLAVRDGLRVLDRFRPPAPDAPTAAPAPAPGLRPVPPVLTSNAPVARDASAVAPVLRALRLADALAVALAVHAVAAVAGYGGHQSSGSLAWSALAVAVAVPMWLGALVAARAYEPRYLFAGSSEIHRVGIAGAGAALVVSVGGWVLLPREDAPVVLAGLAAAFGLTVALRWVIRMRVQQANRAGVARTSVLVVGDRQETMPLVARLERNSYHGWKVVADHTPERDDGADPRADPGGAHPGADPAAHARTVRSILAAADQCDASLVLLTPGAGASLASVSDLQRALHDARRDLALAPPLVEAVGPRVSVGSVCGLPITRISAPETRGPRRAVKDVADRAVALAAIVGLAPLLIGLALAVRLTSRGPAVYRQKRVGRDGRLFTIWKFRTMYVDGEQRQAAVDAANEGAGPLFKMRRDPRVTPVGRLLRRTSLDELPQLVNVLRGDMSVVGPRPALAREVDQYDEVTRRRLMVRPGITGLWQVHGRSDLSWEETKRLDVRYVENWSLGFDLSILVRTVDAVLLGKGAY